MDDIWGLKDRITLLEETIKSNEVALTDAHTQFEQAIVERNQAQAALNKYREHLEELILESTTDLRESETRYRSLFDNVPIGLYRSTPEGQMIDVNQALVEMLGYSSKEDLLTVNSSSFYIDPEEREGWTDLMAKAGVVRDYEVKNRRKDGKVIWVKDTARTIKDEEGKVLYYEGSLEDITEQKRAEAEVQKYREHLEELVEDRTARLRESEERFRTLFDGVPVGLYRSTPSGQLLDANQAFMQIMGFTSRQTLLSANASTLYVDPKERVKWKDLMEQEGVVSDFEVQCRQSDGTNIWISEAARAIRDKKGQVIYYEGSVKDITDRKRIEEEILRQKEYFEALFVNSPVAALTADLNAEVVSWNPMAEELFGYSQVEAVGQLADNLVANHPSIQQEAVGYTEQVFREGTIQAVTKRSRKNGTLVDVELRSVPVVVAGKMVGYIAIYHDISELQSARRTAEAANQAKSTFLANMSHELRTPLNAILGFTQLMASDPNLTVEQKENLAIINRSGEHLLALINDVLEMSKIESGRVTLQEKSIDLYRLLDTLEEMFQLRAKAKDLELIFEQEEGVPQYVQTDEGKLRQILMNLIGNAIKFTEDGGVALRTAIMTEGRKLIFEVRDTGPGIDPEDVEAMFEPFQQTTSGKQSMEGTGLGLSISRQFARLMGGDITVKSELGYGSVFRFIVPISRAEKADIEVLSPSFHVLGLEPGQATYRLMVVDDKDASRQLLVKLLEPLGFEIREAIDGEEAIEIWEHWQPHLIWMDMRMPGMDGYQATRQIKGTTEGHATVIVALTASAFEEDRETILSAGCDDLVRKPFRNEEIFNQLSKHLGVHFIYSQEPIKHVSLQPVEIKHMLTPSILESLPAGWLSELQQATVKANINMIFALLDQIRDQNEALANTLADLARNFEYKKIQTIIEHAGG